MVRLAFDYSGSVYVTTNNFNSIQAYFRFNVSKTITLNSVELGASGSSDQGWYIRVTNDSGQEIARSDKQALNGPNNWHLFDLGAVTLTSGDYRLYLCNTFEESKGLNADVGGGDASRTAEGVTIKQYNGITSPSSAEGYDYYDAKPEVAFNFTVPNTAPTTPGNFTSPWAGKVLKGGETETISWGPSSDVDNDSLTYFLEYSYNGSVFNSYTSGSTTSRFFSVSGIEANETIQFRVRARDSNNAYSSYRYSDTYTIEHNADPTITLDTSDNQTLYENDTFTIDGQASDADNGNVVNVKYQINSGQIKAIATDISDGSTAIPFNETLTFREGMLYDKNNNAVTPVLSDGIAHALKVWSEDDQGGKSAIATRNFYVVANRPPAITIDSFTTVSDLINPDQIQVTGTVDDPEGNNLKVKYKINDGTFTQFFDGPSGDFAVNIPVSNLIVGNNDIRFEVVDNYGFVTSKTITLNKEFDAVELLKATARYELDLPDGGINQLVAWIEREIGDLTVEAAASMVLEGEQENFSPMTLSNSANINDSLQEDDFRISSDTVKDKVTLKLSLERTEGTSTQGIKQITGTLLI